MFWMETATYKGLYCVANVLSESTRDKYFCREIIKLYTPPAPTHPRLI